ncbi:MarR family winged helix-turn-helix transcriptional regulator [Alteromonas sp. a30]|uniref:MarR family winged helix-turn-helix transcriptional regulator n=1 Tax=Alteromonas sp. a30 TaxID=2730917 RepID=UPI0022814369|nr:MarR family winged helix-turn-helix transcriptional regulator [Alteromonas sp. a30]MCY7295567.1 winged helix-turn-helix transcriptional regulator [Alteromonas sp. a30]
MSEDRLFFLMHLGHHAMFKLADKRCMTRLNISCVQLSALLFLQKNDGCLLKDLSAGLALNNSAITGLVTRMLNTDLVKKSPCKDDARSYRIYLSDKAKDILPKGYELLREFNQKIAATFSPEEMQVVTRFLASLTQVEDRFPEESTLDN